MVHQLEDHLGVRLLDRSKRPFVLTPEGEVFHEGCRKLVQRYFALEEEWSDLLENRLAPCQVETLILPCGYIGAVATLTAAENPAA